MMRSLAALALAFLLGNSHAAESAVSLVNIAGEQRMLSQRIAKSYSQIGLNVAPNLAMRQLNEAITRFEANVEKLRPGVVGIAPAVTGLERLVADWQALRLASAAPVSREAALALAQRSEDVLVAAERLTRWLENSAHASDRLINLAGRQRMLSQRVAKNYMLRTWGIDSQALRDEMEIAVREFSEGLASLRSRAENSDEIRRELDEVAQQWEWFQAALAGEGAISYRLIVAESADAILDATDRITRLYEQGVREPIAK